MEETGASAEQSGGSQRRRRRASSRETRWYGPDRIKALLPWIALLFGVIWLVMSIKQFRDQYYSFGPYLMQQSKAETLYGFNAPQQVRGPGGWIAAPKGRDALFQADEWRYELSGGANVDIAFGPDQRARRISCGGRAALPQSCPTAWGVSVGDDEQVVVYKLGAARSERFSGTAKTSSYPGLGMELGLEQFRVTRITLEDQGGGVSAFPLYLRWALP